MIYNLCSLYLDVLIFKKNYYFEQKNLLFLNINSSPLHFQLPSAAPAALLCPKGTYARPIGRFSLPARRAALPGWPPGQPSPAPAALPQARRAPGHQAGPWLWATRPITRPPASPRPPGQGWAPGVRIFGVWVKGQHPYN